MPYTFNDGYTTLDNTNHTMQDSQPKMEKEEVQTTTAATTGPATTSARIEEKKSRFSFPDWMVWYKKPEYRDFREYATAIRTGRRPLSRDGRDKSPIPARLSLEKVLANETCEHPISSTQRTPKANVDTEDSTKNTC